MKYCGIGLFKHRYDDPNRITKFEERIVLTNAGSKAQAEKQILFEFQEYAAEEIQFLGEFIISEICEGDPVSEVGNIMRIFDGPDEEYVKMHWNSGHPDTCNEKGWHHVWYNKGSGISACYNCKEERSGELWKSA